MVRRIKDSIIGSPATFPFHSCTHAVMNWKEMRREWRLEHSLRSAGRGLLPGERGQIDGRERRKRRKVPAGRFGRQGDGMGLRMLSAGAEIFGLRGFVEERVDDVECVGEELQAQRIPSSRLSGMIYFTETEDPETFVEIWKVDVETGHLESSSTDQTSSLSTFYVS